MNVYGSFTNIVQPTSVLVSVGLGVYPSTSIVYFLPQIGNIPSVGTLGVYGTNGIELYGCAVDAVGAVMSDDERGEIWYAKIFDRRWAWQYRLVSGYYNIRSLDGSVISTTQRTPQQLATILLNALGETAFNVTALPNDGYPTVTWQFSSARRELEQLCHARGCDIAYSPIGNSVYIVKLGEGSPAVTNQDAQSVAATVDPPATPDSLVGVMGESLYESMFSLQAVGLDTDGEWKPIADLSYTPSGGWETEADVEYFSGISDETARSLARQTVYRNYQVENFADGTLNVQGRAIPLSTISQAFPLERNRLASYDADTGAVRPKPAVVGGYFIAATDPPAHTNSEDFVTYDGGFVLEKSDGIVRFPRPMYLQNGSDQPVPADLFLTTSFGIKDATTGEPEYRAYQYNLPSFSIGSQSKQRIDLPEIGIRHVVEWNTSAFPPSQVAFVSNVNDIDAEAVAVLGQRAAQYTAASGSVVHYRDIQTLYPNGVLRQVQWKVDEYNGATTIGYNNYEYAPSMSRAVDRRARSQSDADFLLARRRAALENALASRGALRQP